MSHPLRLMRRWFRAPRIAGKLQFAVGLAFVVGLALVLAGQTISRIDATHAERRNANIRVVEVLADHASGTSLLENESVVYGYLELLTADPRVAGLVIVKGDTVAKTQQSLEHLEMSMDDLSAAAIEASRTGELQVVDAGGYEYVGAPIKDGEGRVAGSFGIGWNLKGLVAGVWWDALKQAALLACLVGAILLVLSITVRRMVTRPLTAIAGAMDRQLHAEQASGAADAPETELDPGQESRNDEIGALARALRRLRQHREERDRLAAHLDLALSNMSQGLSMYDKDQRLVLCNDRYGEMYKLSSELTKPGTSMREVVEARVANGVYVGKNPEFYVEERLAWVATGEPDFQIDELNDGRTFAVSRRPIPGGGWVSTHADITEVRQFEEQIAYMAHHDALTALPNRTLLREHMTKLMPRARRGDQFSVLCLDLDRFKAVNDTLGHSVGDELLKAVAEKLRDCVRESDMVARLGGDEFAIVQSSRDASNHAETLAGRVCELLAEPFDLTEHQVAVGASVGIAIAPEDGDDPDQLMKNGDLALYRAKSDGRGRYCFFEPEMDARMQARRELELDLRKALQLHEFELHYQPLVDLQSGEVSGMEALLRWNHPQRGLVPPADFVPLAEDIGLIVPLGAWVIRTACAEAAHWPRHVKVAVNLSPAQFRSEDLVQTVFSALADSGIAAERLELEITERVLLQDTGTTLETLGHLHGLGVRIAMDDFGTGYSSLSYLRSFPFDKIKIDRSFVSDLSEAAGESPIVNAVASMSRSLGMATTAEGVETEEQLKMVKAAGYSEMQGFLFSPPRKADEIARLYFGGEDAEEADKADETPAVSA